MRPASAVEILAEKIFLQIAAVEYLREDAKSAAWMAEFAFDLAESFGAVACDRGYP